ncbi:MAG: hypothetical protein K6A96_07260 [Prevotella sp.]|nr:hypothetical protein [Prevotella sp.]
MKKRLLTLAAFVLTVVGSAFALNVGEYAYTDTLRLKITGENLVQNGNFANARDGWTGADGNDVSTEVWDFVEGAGPNGENVLQTTAGTAGVALCNKWDLQGGTYVVKFDIKGETTTALRASSIGGNYAAFFLNTDGALDKADDATLVSVEGQGYKDEWQTVTCFFTAEDGQKLCMHFEQLTTGVMVTNIEIYPAVKVYDIRKLQRKLNYIDGLLASGAFTNDVTSEGGTSFLEMVGMIREWVNTNDPMLESIDEVEAMVAEYDATLLSFLNANSADLLAGEKRWSTYGDTRKVNDFGNWHGSGGRWFHINNGGSNMITNNEDEIGHRLQGGMAAGAACMHYTITPGMNGKIMFSLDILGHYMANTSSSWGNYVTDFNRDFRGVTFYGGPDTLWTDAEVIAASQNTKIDCGVISHQYAQTFTIVVDAVAGQPLTFGISYVPDPDHTAGKYGSNVNIANPQLRLIGITQLDYDYQSELVNINTQQTELAARIATAKEKVAQTKADGFPWGHSDLNTAIEEAQAVLDASYGFMQDGNVVNEAAIRELMTEGNTKESDAILASVNAIKRAWEAFESLNASFTALQAKADEAQSLLDANAGKGNAARRAALEALVAEAKAMIEATGEESEKEAFDAKTAEISDAMASFLNSLTNYYDPSLQTIQSPNPETGSAPGWTFTETVSGKENFKKSTQGSGWRAGYHTAVWRGNSASPQSKTVQTKTISDPGVYGFMVNAMATNENYANHLGMATIIDADPDLGIVADTIFNKSEVKVFFGENGVPDSVRVISRQRLNTGNKNSGAGSATESFGYDANQYVVYFLKTGDQPIEIEFGMSSYGQIDGAGANTYGFGDTELWFYGNETDFRADMVADMRQRIAACQAVLDANMEEVEVTNEETGETVKQIQPRAEVATWVSRLQRRLVDANAALQQTATIQDLTALANATFFVEEIVAHIPAQMDGIRNISTNDNSSLRPIQEGIYNLQGVKMNGENLPAGLYIVNGRKVVIK